MRVDDPSPLVEPKFIEAAHILWFPPSLLGNKPKLNIILIYFIKNK
jgi:hypothetical protein